jgi:hypothetical protein
MEITSFGLVLLPIVAFASLRPEWLLQLIFFASMFGGASAINIGGFGVVPELVPAAAFVGYVLFQKLLGVRYPGEAQALRTLTPLLFMTAYALIGAFVIPHLLEGRALVHPQKPEIGVAITPLAFGNGNLTQGTYLAADVIFATVASCFLTRSGINYDRVFRAFFLAGFMEFGFAVWGFANKMTGLWFPSDFLHSNPGYLNLDSQQIGGVVRASGTFTEPSALGGAMGTYVFACVWVLVNGHASHLARWLLPCALLGVIISTSTTGYAGLTVGCVYLTGWAIISASERIMRNILTGGVGLLLAGAILALVVVTLAPGVERAAAEVFAGTIDKPNSNSYDQRTSWDQDSIATLLPTYGLGVGWGSNRSSSLVPGLLANLGIYGFALLPWFVLRIREQVALARSAATGPVKDALFDAMNSSVFGSLIFASISASTINSIGFFLQVSLIIGYSSTLYIRKSSLSKYIRLSKPKLR